MNVIGVGVIGVGYWGPKHARNFAEVRGSRLAMVADLDERRLSAMRDRHPGLHTTTQHREMLDSPGVDAVVIATNASTHVRLAREALLAGKHVLVEKPIAVSGQDAEELIQLAECSGLTLMVGHTFLYHPAVRALHDIVQSGELGEIYYAHAQRLNLGQFQRDINVLWDLAPHDLSILMYVLGMNPIGVAARGSAYVQAHIEDVGYVDLTFPNRIRAQIHVSWLDPNKVRRLTIVGSQKMVVYDDVETLEKLRVYDRGVDAPPHTDTFGEFQLSYRYGDITIPALPSTEPLRVECEHFLECIRTGRKPLTDGWHGLQVVRILELAEASLRDGNASLPRLEADHRLLVSGSR